MSTLLRLLFGRGGRFGLLSDIVLVVTAVQKLARTPVTSSGARGRRLDALGAGEWILLGAAAFRLSRRLIGRRSSGAATEG